MKLKAVLEPVLSDIQSWSKAFISDLWTLMLREDPRDVRLLDRSSLLFLLVAAVWYSSAYLCYPLTPANDSHGNPGWWAWFDQGEYYKSTAALSNWDVIPSLYWIGYPILGAPFFQSMPRHPYFIPNLTLVLIMTGSFFAICRCHVGRIEAWLLVIYLIFKEKILRNDCLLTPWNTLPVYASVFLLAYLLIFSRPNLGSFIVSALAIGVTLLARPGEIIPLAPLYLFGLLNLAGNPRRIFAIVFLGCVVALVAATMFSLNLYLYGQLTSPYMQGESVKFSPANFGIKVYQLFVDGTFLTGDAVLQPDAHHPRQLIERFPYLLLALPGAIYLWRDRGPAIFGFFLAILFTLTFYLLYSVFNNTPYFWNYGSYHYIWWITPWFGFLAYLSLRRALFVLPWRVYLAALALPIALYLLVGYSAGEVAATDARENPLQMIVSPVGPVCTVTLVVPDDIGSVQDVRLTFQTPPPYPGSSSETGDKVHVKVNDVDQPDYERIKISQDGPSYDISFLSKGLDLKKGDRITIIFSQAPDIQLSRASLRRVHLDLGKKIRELLAR